MKKLNRFDVYVLDLNELIKYGEHNEKNQPFKIDSKYNNNFLTKHNIEKIADNALFFQISEAKKEILKDKTEISQDYYLKDILFVDFSNSIRNISNKSYKEKMEFLFIDGFILNFGNGEEITYNHFEKSNSMSKNCIISFIRDDIRNEMKKRVTLNIEPKECFISKYYAYKGLLLTPGVRISPTNEKFILDENTVIVVNDIVNKKRLNSCYTVEEVEKQKKETNFIKYDLKKRENVEVEINLFDGEGLISLEYAEILSDLIKETDSIFKATSFQFRLPFGKGMLHSVDFKGFFKEHNITKIEDCFGISHNIDDIEIIMTLSQFKAYKWFKEKYEYSEIWKKYWEDFKAYKHAFYVVSTNRDESKFGNVASLNYQVLNTLDLSYNEFEKLLSDSKESYELLKKNNNAKLIELLNSGYIYKSTDISINNELSEDENTDISSPFINKETIGKEVEISEDTNNIIIKALEKNNDLLKTKVVKDMISTIEDSKINDYKKGRLLVKGKIKLLSGDLLEFLIKLAMRNSNQQFSFDECIETDQFYVPRDNSYKEDKIYSIFRNPHISRAEHVVAKALIPKKNSEREKYLGHLQGVVMLNPWGMFSDRLGGADYDGDIVKIIDNETFISGAESGKNEDLQLIPRVISEPKELNDKNCFHTVLDTFDNHVGIISNMAFRNAKIAYNKNNDEMTDEQRKIYLDKVRKLAILTGLEIDSAKHGKKPYIHNDEYIISKNISEKIYIDIAVVTIDKKKKEIKNDFIDYKKALDENLCVKEIEYKDDNEKDNAEKTSETTEEARMIPTYAANIDRIPYKVKKISKINNKTNSLKNKGFSSLFYIDDELKNQADKIKSSDLKSIFSACRQATNNVNKKIYFNKMINSTNKAGQRTPEQKIGSILLETNSKEDTEKKTAQCLNFFENVNEHEKLMKMMKNIQSYLWEFTEESKRKGIFDKITENCKDDLTGKDSSVFYENFKRKGFNLLRLSIEYQRNKLFEKQRKYTKNTTKITAIKGKLEKQLKKYIESNNLDSEEINKKFNLYYLEKIYKVFSENIKEANTLKKELIKKIKNNEDLEETKDKIVSIIDISLKNLKDTSDNQLQEIENFLLFNFDKQNSPISAAIEYAVEINKINENYLDEEKIENYFREMTADFNSKNLNDNIYSRDDIKHIYNKAENLIIDKCSNIYEEIYNKNINKIYKRNFAAQCCILLCDADENNSKILWGIFPEEAFELLNENRHSPIKNKNGKFTYEFQNYDVESDEAGESID